MKPILPVSGIFAAVLLILTSNANAAPRPGSVNPELSADEQIIGTWNQSAGPAVFAVRPDGSFTMDMNGDGAADISGKYELTGNVIRLIENSPECPDAQSGYYRFFIVEDMLFFKAKEDSCVARNNRVLRHWKRAQ